MALRGRRIKYFFNYGGWWVQEVLPFEFHQQVFKKIVSAGLNSLWQMRYQILVKNWIIDDLFNKKERVLVILVPEIIQPRIRIFFDEMRLSRSLRPLRLLRLLRSLRLQSFKAWKITPKDFRVIHVIEFSFILMFFKEKVLGRIMKYPVEF